MDEQGLLALASIILVIGLIAQQAQTTRRFWEQSITDAPEESPDKSEVS
jgi:hypothetical protein